jgi:hypothetical protein
MKIIIIYTLLCSNLLLAQKFDNNWIIGYNFNNNPKVDSLYGNINIQFTDGFIETTVHDRGVNFDRASISISDPISGELLLYSNGCRIYESNNRILLDTLNPGSIHDRWCIEDGYPYPSNGCFLNIEDKPNLFYLLHHTYEYSGIPTIGSLSTKLAYTVMIFKNNEWQILESKKSLLNQWLYSRSFGVTRHGNGRDWWIIEYNYDSDTCFRFLLTETGFQGPMKQFFPMQRGEFDWGSNSLFSPDGTKYVRIDLRTGLTIANFDRMTGLLSELKFYPIWIDKSEIDNLQVMNLSISPNSKFLYISTPFELWQFDLGIEDVYSSKIRIDSFDGFASPFGTTFYRHQLAPDGKIYLNCTNGDNYFHVIHKPNEKGKLCEFKQHDFLLPVYNAFTLPFFPNYRLKKLNQSIDPSFEMNFSAMPNPVNDELFINKPIMAQYYIYNSLGQFILSGNSSNINVANLRSGIYYISLDKNYRSKFKSIKFIKI